MLFADFVAAFPLVSIVRGGDFSRFVDLSAYGWINDEPYREARAALFRLADFVVSSSGPACCYWLRARN